MLLQYKNLKWFTLLLVSTFFIGALLFCTSMLSTSTMLRDRGATVCEGIEPVDQVVVILIDALRPDFALSALRAFTREEGGCAIAKSKRELESAYGGATLNYIEHSLRDPVDPSHGYLFVADAPTTTAQRIKAIATGTMPAFLEAGSNFNSDAVEMDSIIRQMDGRTVVLGDDTWVKLFPHQKEGGRDIHWKKSIVLPSFDVGDFHSNDNTVLDVFYGILQNETKEKEPDTYAKLIIGHFLGVDHVGHRINADNYEMSSKLAQLNEMLYNTSKTLEQRDTQMRTMVLVFGDHGMTSSGDHGGDSALETDTFLFAKLFDKGATRLTTENKAALCATNDKRWEEGVDPELKRLETCRHKAEVDLCKLGAAYQVDVTPTISVLLGKPIPFSSFGRVLPEVLRLASPSVEVEKVEQCNLEQINLYYQKARVKVPRNPTWEKVQSVREEIAKKSFYMRRTGTDMNLKGMFFSCLFLLMLAESIAYFPQFRRCFQLSFFGIGSLAVFFMRLFTSFSNSFAINEDTELLSLLSFLILAILLATSTSRTSGTLISRVTLVGFLLFSRFSQSLLLRYREHITHNVASSSALEDMVSSVKIEERIGILTSIALVFFWYRSRLPRWVILLLGINGGLLCLFYKVPVLHHCPLVVTPIVFCLAASPAERKLWPVVTYLTIAAWCSSLCNEKVIPSVVIALYGHYLPLFLRAIRPAPIFTQALAIHLLSYGAFFLEGHQTMLNTIDWNASFVGMPFYNMFFGGVWVITRTFNAFLLVPLAIKVAGVLFPFSNEKETVVSIDTLRHLVIHLTVCNGAVSCFNGYIQKNHLMLFPIFCPKLIFDVVIALVSGIAYFLTLPV